MNRMSRSTLPGPSSLWPSAPTRLPVSARTVPSLRPMPCAPSCASCTPVATGLCMRPRRQWQLQRLCWVGRAAAPAAAQKGVLLQGVAAPQWAARRMWEGVHRLLADLRLPRTRSKRPRVCWSASCVQYQACPSPTNPLPPSNPKQTAAKHAQEACCVVSHVPARRHPSPLPPQQGALPPLQTHPQSLRTQMQRMRPPRPAPLLKGAPHWGTPLSPR
mmetsp:Transcript_16131/g.44059  ORF Transcript_16131/g.44059 Transcript_16131/m.44059 type:complete len:217 (-) Transcript_16131:114-764(-)